MSEKFDFQSQPAEVVLSVKDIEHDNGGSWFDKKSIQGPTMEATCSSMLMLALCWRCGGMRHHHACPLSL